MFPETKAPRFQKYLFLAMVAVIVAVPCVIPPARDNTELFRVVLCILEGSLIGAYTMAAFYEKRRPRDQDRDV